MRTRDSETLELMDELYKAFPPIEVDGEMQKQFHLERYSHKGRSW